MHMPYRAATGRHPCLLLVLAALLAAVAAGCTQSVRQDLPNFDRHRYSAVVEPRDRRDVMYFDVIFTADYPDGDPAAEATRMAWLSAWIEQRHLCPGTFEIVQKRPFEFTEDNPGHYDARYLFKCKAGTSG
jgi:hypothetical protein